MNEKKKNWGVAMVQSKSGLETDWNDVDLKNAVHKHNDMRDF